MQAKQPTFKSLAMRERFFLISSVSATSFVTSIETQEKQRKQYYELLIRIRESKEFTRVRG